MIMKKKKASWKTTLLGLATIGSGVVLFIKGDVHGAIVSFTSGVGLILAKDFDVTHSD